MLKRHSAPVAAGLEAVQRTYRQALAIDARHPTAKAGVEAAGVRIGRLTTELRTKSFAGGGAASMSLKSYASMSSQAAAG